MLSGRSIRTATGDTVNGTTIDQVDKAISFLRGEDDLSTGYWFPKQFHELEDEGKGVLLAIRYREVLKYHRKQLRAGVKQKDLVGGIEQGFGESPDDWHAVTKHRTLEAGASTRIDHKVLEAPADEPGVIIYDPLCDGRRPTVAEGPVVYPMSLFKRVMNDSNVYGGKVYAAATLDGRIDMTVTPTPKPKVTLKYGGKRIPRRVFTAKKPGWKRTSPYRSLSNPTNNRLRHLARGQRFVAFQTVDRTRPGEPAGKRKWYGSRSGDVWVHASRFKA